MGGRAAYVLATALFIGSGGPARLLRLSLRHHSQSHRLSDSDLHRPGDHRAELSRHAPAALPGRRPGLRAGAGDSSGLIFVDKIFGDPTLLQSRHRPRSLADSLNAEEPNDAPHAGQRLHRHQPDLGLRARRPHRPPPLARRRASSSLPRCCTLFGIMHSPAPGSPMFFPWQIARRRCSATSSNSPLATPPSPSLLFAWGGMLTIAGSSARSTMMLVRRSNHHAA